MKFRIKWGEPRGSRKRNGAEMGSTYASLRGQESLHRGGGPVKGFQQAEEGGQRAPREGALPRQRPEGRTAGDRVWLALLPLLSLPGLDTEEGAAPGPFQRQFCGLSSCLRTSLSSLAPALN